MGENNKRNLPLKGIITSLAILGVIIILGFGCGSGFKGKVLIYLENSPSFGKSTINESDAPSPSDLARQHALLIYQRLAGVRVSIDHPDLDFMEERLVAGDPMGAAQKAMESPNFYRITVKDLGLKMSNQEETIRVPLNDMTATIIGIIRDEINAKEMLVGNFYYRGKEDIGEIPSDPIEDILLSNNHYEALENEDNRGVYASQGGLAGVLVRVDGQVVKGPGNTVVANPSAAGVITSRAYMMSTATMGTNRAVIADTLKKFTCRSIEEASDTSAPDTFIGRDVARLPGGSPKTFLNKCKGCHTILDAFKPATAYIDFEDGYLKHGKVLPSSGEADSPDPDLIDANNGIPIKLTRNSDVAPDGYEIVHNQWVNHALGGGNASYFQWRGASSGTGLSAYAQLLAESKAFSNCMVYRIYQSVCKRDLSREESDWLNEISSSFESNNYNLKWLFARVTIDPNCIGEQKVNIDL